MSDIKHYKNVSYVKGHVRVNLRFAKYGPRFAKAQEWLGKQVLADSKLYMPLKTGSLQQRSYVAEGGRQVVFPGPYARYLYMGKVMVDPGNRFTVGAQGRCKSCSRPRSAVCGRRAALGGSRAKRTRKRMGGWLQTDHPGGIKWLTQKIFQRS